MEDLNVLDQEDISDINTAAATIKKRSDGLLEFVKDYRKLSNVPIPQLKTINVKKLLEDIKILMSPITESLHIDLNLGSVPSNAKILADQKLAET